MAKNIQSLQLLRNTSMLYATRDAALTALTGDTIPGGNQDGTPVLARYKGTDGKIYTLVGYYAVSSAITGGDSATSHMTVFDIEGSTADVKKLENMIGSGVTTDNTVTKQLAALSGNSESLSGDTSVAGAKKYADEQVRAALDVLSATSLADDNKVVSDVTQANGKVTATVKNLTDVKLAGLSATADTKITSTDTLGGALAKLQGQIDSMDKAAEAVNGQVVTTVAETDGKVTETKANVKDLQLGGYSKEANATGDIAANDTVNTALSKLENKVGANKVSNIDHSIVVTEPTGTATTDIKVNINSNEKVIKLGDNGIYTNLNLVKVDTGLAANVKEKYQLLASDNSQIGVDIEIPRDSALQNVYLGHVDDKLTNADAQGESVDKTITSGTGDAALVYVMQLSSGKYKLTAVNVESFLSESEFADGLQVNNHKVSVKVDTSSEKVTTGENVTGDVLTVSTDGVKVNNIQNAINYAISKLDANVTGGTTAGTKTNGHIQIVVDEADGKLTAVTVNEANIADADKLADLSGKTVTAVAMTGGTANIVDNDSDGTKKITINTDGSQIFMTGYAKGSDSGAVANSDSINVAISKLENQIASKVDALNATVSGQTADGKVKVQVVQENGVLTAVTVTGTGIASDSALAAEIAARKDVDGVNGDAYTADTNAHYISGASSLYGADQALDRALNTVDNAMLTEVVAGNGITVSNKEGKSQTISVKVKDNDGGIVNDATGLHLGIIDCGVY